MTGVTMAKEIEPVSTFAYYGAIEAAGDPMAKREAAKAALAIVQDEAGGYTYPAFLMDLPWAVGGDEAITDILIGIMTAASLEDATAGTEPEKVEGHVNEYVTIYDVRVRPSDVEDEWQAYMSLDVTFGTSDRHYVLNTGARQVMVTVWRAWCQGQIPLQGQIVALGAPQRGRSQPIGLRVITPFDGD